MTIGRLVVALVAVAVAGAPVGAASPADDQAFLGALDREGISYPSPKFAITTAKEVCTLLDDGATGVDVAWEISNTNGIPVGKAGYFVGASISAYCPQHTGAF